MMLGGGGGGDGDYAPFDGGMAAMVAGILLEVNPAPETVGTSGRRARGKEERIPQWGTEETRDLISIRADLERRDLSSAAAAARGKTMWEEAASRMRELGHRRTPEQCKCKWKNLVNRYKGKETADADNARQCPFFDELNAVFLERANSMRRQLLESESGTVQPSKKPKRLAYSDELSDDDHNRGCEEETDSKSRRKKPPADSRGKASVVVGGSGVQELLRELLQQRRRMEAKWQEMVERRARERLVMEEEWRRRMEGLERERRAMEEAWREREEQRRAREESRAEKREALLTTLLNKLIQDEL